MASRRPTRGARPTVAFEALSIEGGLLSPEWLARLAQRDADQQAEADYRVPRGLQLRDEIGRYWRIAQAWWDDFHTGRARGGDPFALSARFVTVLLTDVLGFTSLKPADGPTEREGRSFPIGFFARGGRVPVVVAPAGEGLDTPSPRFGEGGRRRSAFGLAQEFLNAADEALWGLASDGLTLRLLRDNASLTRPAWVEADLARIFAEERYADFAALWLLLHETRFGSGDAPPTDCPLERWRAAGQDAGTRAREKLRDGVEAALLAFGQGFVAHPDNTALRAALADRTLTPTALYQELLRLAYRLIFLLTVEERSVLHPPDASAAAMALYDGGYSVRRLRERALRRSAHDRFADLWEGLKVVFRGVGRGEPRLALPALGGIFAASQCPTLDGARLANGFLLTGVFRLAWIVGDSGVARVNWRDMGAEELGSVYESLLELVPRVDLEARRFTFASGDEAKGNARKTTGSYYTPDSLVQVLLDSALEPVVKDTVAAHPDDPVAALLDLSVVDPACGSGHFLLAAARRLAGHVARLSANGTPSAAEYRHALRQVVGRCIYGVDLNPMAIELCRVGLWMEAVEPGLALSFLDSHIQCGNALLGATPELLAKGVPDAAWEPIEGDDKKVASALKKRNKAESKGQQVLDTLWAKPAANEVDEVTRAVEALERSPDAQLPEVERRAAQWEEIRGSEAFRHQRFVADAWCAAFVWPKVAGEAVDAAPTNGQWQQIREGKGRASAVTERIVGELTAQYHFFHWHLAFPQVFKRGGFDVVLGNPPWERVKLQEQEFFASSRRDIVEAQNKGSRVALIQALAHDDPALLREWVQALRASDAVSHFLKNSHRYPLCGGGDVNTSSVFAELACRIMSLSGRLGIVVPTSLLTDDTTKDFPRDVVRRGVIVSAYDFDNSERLFPAVRPHQHFVLMTIAGRPTFSDCDYAFFLTHPRQLNNPATRVSLSAEDIAVLNPNTRTIPVFRTSTEAKVTKTIYRANPLLKDDAKGDGGDVWGLRFLTMFHMAADSEEGFLLSEDRMSELLPGSTVDTYRRSGYLPLFDAKMAGQYNHRAASVGMSGHQFRKISKESSTEDELVNPSYEVDAAYWVQEHEVTGRLGDWIRGWLLGFKDVTGITSTRLAAFAFIPRVGVGHPFPLVFLDRASPCLYSAFVGFVNSLLVEFILRQKMQGLHLTYFLIKQLPAPTPAALSSACPWDPTVSVALWLCHRVMELSCTSWQMECLAIDLGGFKRTYRWDEERRFILLAEIDAAIFHLFHLSEEDVNFVISKLEKVTRKDERVWGRPRTQEEVLRAFSAMAEAIRTGRPYVTRLDPPPADPRVAHPDTRTK